MLFLIALYFQQNEWNLMMNSYKTSGFSSVPKNTGQSRAGLPKSTVQVTGCQNRVPCSSLIGHHRVNFLMKIKYADFFDLQ